MRRVKSEGPILSCNVVLMKYPKVSLRDLFPNFIGVVPLRVFWWFTPQNPAVITANTFLLLQDKIEELIGIEKGFQPSTTNPGTGNGFPSDATDGLDSNS